MNRATRTAIIAAAAVVFLISLFLLAPPKHPVALIRVVDGTARPIQGAVITPDGLRPKPGPNANGHFAWTSERMGVPNDPVLTDKNGLARVPYPKYVIEKIETGEISFSVEHPEFVPDRPFRVVSASPPRGAPWRLWLDYLRDRIQRKQLISPTDPVVLQRGASLRIVAQPGSPGPPDTPLFAQTSGHSLPESNYWSSPKPGVLETHRLAPGKQVVRALRFDQDGTPWFSEVLDVTTTVGRTNEIGVRLARAPTVRGQLDPTATRPIKNGRVVAHVWPPGYKPDEFPPEWHAWAPVGPDGLFRLGALPPGDLEVVALCDGFVSTNGPGGVGMRYPQKHTLGSNDLDIVVGMEPTARLEVQVSDQRGSPITGALVTAWPNVRYGERVATILLSDRYNLGDLFLPRPGGRARAWGQPVEDFNGVSDGSGLAVLPNLPSDVTEFAVIHPRLALPAMNPNGGEKRREATITLIPGATNRSAVTLVPTSQAPIGNF